jgi:hypothetical protein
VLALNDRNSRRYLRSTARIDFSLLTGHQIGRRIAFTSDRNDSTNLYVMDADGGNLRRLVTSKGRLLHALTMCRSPSLLSLMQPAIHNYEGDRREGGIRFSSLLPTSIIVQAADERKVGAA